MCGACCKSPPLPRTTHCECRCRAATNQDALDVLLLAEESFSVVSASFLEAIDNVALLLLDVVW